jgi:hypothetical protein
MEKKPTLANIALGDQSKTHLSAKPHTANLYEKWNLQQGSQ